MEEEDPITITSIYTLDPDGNDPRTPVDELEPGMQFGRYVIKKMLGKGGMGVVYAAFDPTLNRKIAIKVLRVSNGSGDMDTQSARTRMLREAQAMAMVGHPNLVNVFDVGTYEDDVYIAMEFVEGVTLRDWLVNHDRKDWRTILKKYIAAARGLHAAHQRRLIHRDFKPENVMVDSNGHVRVMDFGLARHTGADDPNDTSRTPILARPLTQTGMIMGTPAYMAPEQFLADHTDHRTDQFAFCVALYEALYGYRPFRGDTMKALARSVMRGEIVLPPRKTPIPDYILTALLKGLQTDAEDRHDNMGVLIDELTTPPDTSTSGTPWVLYLVSLLVALIGVTAYVTTVDEIPFTTEEKKPTRQAKEAFPDNGPVIPSVMQGTITRDQMDAVIARHQEDIDDCVAQGRKRDAHLEGFVDLQFEIVPDKRDYRDGDVDRVLVKDTDLFDRRTARCILGMSMSWRFPAPSCQGDAGDQCRAEVDARITIPASKKGISPPKKPQ